MMNPKTSLQIALILSALILTSSAASAQVVYPANSCNNNECGQNAGYGACGDGLLERTNNYGGTPLYMEQCDNGKESQKGGKDTRCRQAPFALFYGCFVQRYMEGNGVIERYKMTRFNKTGEDWEDCDDGLLPTDPYSTCEPSGRYRGSYDYPWDDNSTSIKNYDGLQSPNRCGNGVLDKGEECDPGSTSLQEEYHTEGIIGCDSSCKITTTPLKVEITSPTKRSYTCVPDDKLCGNGIVDRYAGEQCDDGLDDGVNPLYNGSDTSNCSTECTWKKINPTFSRDKDSVLYLTPSNDGIMDGNPGHAKGVGSQPINPIGNEADDSTGKIGTNLVSKDQFDIYDRGRVVYLKRNAGHQYSAILDSKQKIDDGVDIAFTLRPQEQGTEWDNDTFGLVFGIDPNTVFDRSNHTQNYIMVKWRSSKGSNSGDYSNVGKKCSKPVFAGDTFSRGLRVYHIGGGVPDYDELWDMKNCGTDNSKHYITHIPTVIYPGPIDGNHKFPGEQMLKSNQDAFALQNSVDGPLEFDKRKLKTLNDVQKYRYNRIVNPAFTYNTYYLRELAINQDSATQVVRVRAHYDKNGLQVWLNSQKVIDISSEASSIYKGSWPKEGHWGFYFLGMDNFIADFRSSENRNNVTKWDKSLGRPVLDFNQNAYKAITNATNGTRCQYCGDGIVNGISPNKEECDDGNNTSGDGCEAPNISTHTLGCTITTGWNCYDTSPDPQEPENKKRTPSICYTGEITEPKAGSSIGGKTVIQGTYKGAVDRIQVETSNGCQGEAEIDSATGTWSADPKKICSTSSGEIPDGSVTITVTFYAKGEPATKGLKKSVTVKVDSQAPVFTIGNPNPWYTKSIGNSCPDPYVSIPSDSTSIHGEFDCKRYNWEWGGTFPITSLSFTPLTPSPGICKTGKNTKNWCITDSLPLSDGEGKYTFNIKAVSIAVPPMATQKELVVIVDKTSPTLESSKINLSGVPFDDAGIVIAKGGKITIDGVSGSIHPEGNSTAKDFAPVKLKVRLVQVPSDSSTSIAELPCNEGVNCNTATITGFDSKTDTSFNIDIPYVPSSKGGYGVVITAIDAAGNEAEIYTSNPFLIVDSATPRGIYITPASGSELDPSSPSVDSNKVNVQIAVQPKLSDLGNKVKVLYCVGDNSSVPCTPNTKATCNPKGGLLNCEVPLDPKKSQYVVVKASAPLGESSNTEETSSFTYNPRDITKSKPQITKPDDNATVTLSNPSLEVSVKLDDAHDGDKAQILVGVLKTTNDSGSAKEVFVPSASTECEYVSGNKTCTTQISPDEFVNNDIYLDKDGKVEIKAVVTAKSRNSSQEADPVKVTIAPRVSVNGPISSVASGTTLKGKIEGGTCTGACKVTVRICDVPVEKGACTEENSLVIDATVNSDGTWSASIPSDAKFKDGSPLVANGKYQVAPVLTPSTNGFNIVGYPKVVGESSSDTPVDSNPNSGPVTPGGSKPDKDKPKFVTPCLPGEKLANGGFCQASSNGVTKGNPSTIDIEIEGPAGKPVGVVIQGNDGKKRTVCAPATCTSSGCTPSQPDCVFDSSGKFTKKNVPLTDDAGSPLSEPVVVKATTYNGSTNPSAESDPIVPSGNPVIKKLCGKNDKACTPGNASKPGYIPVDVSSNGSKATKVDITIVGADGKKINACEVIQHKRTCTYNNGKVTGEVPPIITEGSDKGQPLKGPFKIIVKNQDDGKESIKTDVPLPVVPNAGGVVAGGCSCASTDSGAGSGLVSLLLASLGLVALRRRRDEE